MRVNLAALFLVLLLISGNPVLAQSPNGSISGLCSTPDTKSIPGAEVIVVNDLTGIKYQTSTNGDGVWLSREEKPGEDSCWQVNCQEIGHAEGMSAVCSAQHARNGD